jgi:hypothetical protein
MANREKRIQAWNVFGTSPWASGHETKELCYAVCRKVFKVITYIVMFVVIMGVSVLSKGSFLVAVSMLKPLPEDPAEQHPDLECRDYTAWFNRSVAYQTTNKTTRYKYEWGYDNFTRYLHIR